MGEAADMAMRQELDGHITREYYRAFRICDTVPPEALDVVEPPDIVSNDDYWESRAQLAAASQRLADAFERTVDAVTHIPYWQRFAERHAWQTAIREYERSHFTGAPAMGEAADMILEGILDEETGELIDGEATGYPRSPAREARHRMRRRKPAGTTPCPVCGKRYRGDAGLAAHYQAKHPTEVCPVEMRQ